MEGNSSVGRAENQDADKAQELATLFKRQGHFDKLKHKILTNKIEPIPTEREKKQNIISYYDEDDETSNTKVEFEVEELIKLKVKQIVQDMVEKDSDLVFKNRGTNTALIESKIFKDDYNELSLGQNAINLNQYIHNALTDPDLIDEILHIVEPQINAEDLSINASNS